MFTEKMMEDLFLANCSILSLHYYRKNNLSIKDEQFIIIYQLGIMKWAVRPIIMVNIQEIQSASQTNMRLSQSLFNKG